MIQLTYASGSEVTNKAVWVGFNYTGSRLKLYLTSSFTGDVTGIDADIISSKTTPYGGWLLYEIPRNEIPSNSGQYDINIYELEISGSNIWIDASSTWTNTTSDWENYSAAQVIGEHLDQDRVIVSGSDYDPVYDHRFNDESNFYVYNG